MSWVETPSLSFSARHEADDDESAERTLDALEDLRIRLEERFEVIPDEVTVIVHPSPAWLAAAHPFLPLARWAASPSARRYLAGWAMAREIHVLDDEALIRRAAGEQSERALLGTAERLYAQIVLATNNTALPPPWGPRQFARYLRWAWLIEGGAVYFAGHVPLFRSPVIRRLREAGEPSFPPSARDAIILGGTVFDLLDREVGPHACELLVRRLRKEGEPAEALEAMFNAPVSEVESAWRTHLAETVPRA